MNWSKDSCNFTADFAVSIKKTNFQSRAMIRAIEEFHNIFPRNSLVRRYVVAKYHITEEPFHFTCKRVLPYLQSECQKRSNGTWSKDDEAVHAIDSRKTDFHKDLMLKLGSASVKQKEIWIKKRDDL